MTADAHAISVFLGRYYRVSTIVCVQDRYFPYPVQDTAKRGGWVPAWLGAEDA